MVNTTIKRADSIRLYLKCQLTNAMRYEQIEKFDFEHIIVNTQKNELYEQKLTRPQPISHYNIIIIWKQKIVLPKSIL